MKFRFGFEETRSYSDMRIEKNLIYMVFANMFTVTRFCTIRLKIFLNLLTFYMDVTIYLLSTL